MSIFFWMQYTFFLKSNFRSFIFTYIRFSTLSHSIILCKIGPEYDLYQTLNWYIFIYEKAVFGINQYFLFARERREAEQRLERDRVEKERIEKERMDRERRERERREERDRMEREQRREQERRERERKDQLSKVDEHFKLSMEYHNKVRPD